MTEYNFCVMFFRRANLKKCLYSYQEYMNSLKSEKDSLNAISNEVNSKLRTSDNGGIVDLADKFSSVKKTLADKKTAIDVCNKEAATFVRTVKVRSFSNSHSILFVSLFIVYLPDRVCIELFYNLILIFCGCVSIITSNSFFHVTNLKLRFKVSIFGFFLFNLFNLFFFMFKCF